MLEKDSILNLCVLIALSDFELSKTETAKIIQLSKKLSIQFNVHNAVEEINKKFRDDFDTACDFYCGNIKDIKNDKIFSITIHPEKGKHIEMGKQVLNYYDKTYTKDMEYFI